MPKYLLTANYTDTGMRGLLKEGGSKRREAASKAIEGWAARSKRSITASVTTTLT